jgi:hypothetical protein
VSLKVVDVNGKSVRDFKGPATAVGFHHVQWAPPKAGGYRVVLTVDGKEFAQMVTVENDPNAPPNAVITDAPLPVAGEDADQEKKEGEDKEDAEANEVTPFIPYAEG